MFKISSYPSRAGMGSVLFAHYCSQKPWTQVELWRSCWEGRELEEKAWSLSREAWQPALPLERTDPVLCTHSQVCPGTGELRTEPGIVSVPPVWEANQGQRTVNYLQTRTRWQLWAKPAGSSAPQLFCSPKLVDQGAEKYQCILEKHC